MKNKLNKLVPKQIGFVTVDSGLIWVGDPSYVLPQDDGFPEELGKNWDDFCNKLNPNKITGFNGTGVCVSTTHGDGVYPIIGFLTKKATAQFAC